MATGIECSVRRFYKDVEDIPKYFGTKFVYVFGCTLYPVNNIGMDGTTVASRHFSRPANSPLERMIETHKGTTYAIPMREANMVKSLPFDQIVQSLVALRDKVEVWEQDVRVPVVFHDFMRGQSGDFARSMLPQIRKLFLTPGSSLRGHYVFPGGWYNTEAYRPRLPVEPRT